MTPKSYLYVSDSKVRMLSEGLGRSILNQVDITLSAGLPGVGSAQVSSRDDDLGRFEGLQHLCLALEEQGIIGDVYDEGSEWFRGQMFATWGFHNRQNAGYADVVFFSGYIESRILLGLGGSAYHTMERSEDRLTRHSNSGLHGLMGFLKERSGAFDETTDFYYTLPGAWYSESMEADHNHEGIPEHVEFVAQRLLDEDPHGVRVILGSPLYVARSGRRVSPEDLAAIDAIRDHWAINAVGNKRRLKKRNGEWQIGKPSSPLMPPEVEPI